MRKWIGSLACVVLAVVVLRAPADEEKIPLDKVPKPVLEAVKAKFPGATLVGAEKEKADGKTVFEVKLKARGQAVEVTVTPEGKILTVEKVIEAKDVPKAVTEALEAKYPKATVKLIEEISKDDKVAAYEFQIVTAAKKKLEVQFDPSGKFLEEEKNDEKKEDKKEEKKKDEK